MIYTIIGETLAESLKLFNISAINRLTKSLPKWPHFEVWELDEENFIRLCNISDKDWDASPGGWWRQSSGSILGYPTETFTVKGKEIRLWRDSGTEEHWEEAYEEDYPEKEISYDEYCENDRFKYNDIFDYCCTELGASTERNLSAIFADIAKYNNISIAELIDTYAEGNNK